jgi:hypothetical protein
MVRTRATEEAVLVFLEPSTGRGHGQAPLANASLPPPPHPPISLEQLLATQNDVMRVLMENETRHGADRQQPRQQHRNSSYSDLLVTHPPLFSKVTDLLEADNWLCTIESMFGLLHYTEYQKTLYATQQLRGSAGTWWASYNATLLDDHQLPWGEFHTTFRGHHLSAGLMHHKLVEFLNLQ